MWLKNHFYQHKDKQDPRVIAMLLEIGYMDLDDTLLQHKQTNHDVHLLQGTIGTEQNVKRLAPEATEEERFVRWLE